ncbi:MAG: AcrR family transcriptional regulator [Myxococcota bacterium]|jgi:AcrR family transcriptional regulator
MTSSDKNDPDDNPGTDGRALRSERSRRKIVNALFELVGEGIMRPTAKQVAARADLGIRTVFRHFDDMDSLFEQMTHRLRDELRESLQIEVSDGSPSQRLDDLVGLRCEFIERISPYWRATAAQRSLSKYLTETHHQSDVPRLRANMHRWLPELKELPTDVTDALELILSPEAWHRLRIEQKLSTKRATAAIRRTAKALCQNEFI